MDRPASTLLVAWTILGAAASPEHNYHYPSLDVFESGLRTTAKGDFDGNAGALYSAARWDADRLQRSHAETRAPHLACTEYRQGRQTASVLKALLTPEAVRPAVRSNDNGVCFVATASNAQASAIAADPSRFSLKSFGVFPSAMKIAPGLVQYGPNGADAGKLAATHGMFTKGDRNEGLMVELSPGILRAREDGETPFTQHLLDNLLAESMDLYSSSVWSDPAIVGGAHLGGSQGALRGRAWTRAADIVHRLGEDAGESPADICGWDSVHLHQAGGDVLLVSGTSEVLRVAPWHGKRRLNAAARANIQSATVTDTPLTDAGLDGSGEVVQVVDSGVNETSCFFIDDDGGQVEHGYYFDEIASGNPSFTSSSESFSQFKEIFTGGNFVYDSGRRKVIQYIDMIKSDEGVEETGSSEFPFVPSDEFEEDDTIGHGTHVAGIVAGATLNDPALTDTCLGDEELGCAGGCVSEADESTQDEDDLELDFLCPMMGCDSDRCLGDDVSETLTDHGGMAQGAKLAIFDIFYGDYSYGDFAGNGLWEACLDAGCKVHSNSYGVDSRCELSAVDLLYDEFMYENRENLLLFAAGNDGEYTDRDGLCTISSPGITKNVLAIGATSSGETRLTTTDADGDPADGNTGDADIDTMAVYSSYGPTQDGRIKPEVVAPGDEVYSAGGDDGDDYSCRIVALSGTSQATAVASGAAALVRQYFTDSSFYAKDVTARGFCDGDFTCESFSPSSATVKAMLINSANLMGGSKEPGAFRGFGRIHLEAGMPLSGEGDMALFVADAADTTIAEDVFKDYLFDVDPSAGLELRATLSWIDPPATSMSGVQLVNNLDLRVISPTGKKWYMYADNPWDEVNVNERIIVNASEIEADDTGTWAVRVRSRQLTTDEQSYSLVVTGAIWPGTQTHYSVSSKAESFAQIDDDDYAEDEEALNKGPLVAPALFVTLVLAGASALSAICMA